MIDNIYGQINQLSESQAGPELAHLNVADHLPSVQRQSDKSPILFVIHSYITAVLFVALIGFVITAKFAVAYFRILDRLKQFGS